MRVFADFAVFADWVDKLNKVFQVFLATICHKAIKLHIGHTVILEYFNIKE